VKEKSLLFLVPTPLGNLEDITLRAIRVLREVDLILAEDTRTTGVLIKHLEINNKLKSYHAFNEHRVLNEIISELLNGRRIALVTDAGSPGISDPGFLIVRACIENNIPFECLPGPTALIPALLNSGLPADSFVFIGFLPAKKGRNKLLNQLAGENRTMIFYESPYKLLKSLEDLIGYFGEERSISISREITKLHEQTRRGTLREMKDYFSSHNPRGEFVMVVAGKER
jgi:16S rRNA (cytidine1402-2'-O)-methyltransferase